LSLAQEKVDGIVLHASPKSKETLKELADRVKTETEGTVKTRIVVGDLAQESQVSAIIEQVKDIPVSILINNAGFGANGQFDKIPIETQLKMIAVNCSSLVQLTHHVVEQHRKRMSTKNPSSSTSTPRRIAVANIGSLAAAPAGLPWQTTYAASKAFVSSFTHGIAYSLKEDGVKVVLIEPGTVVDTAFQERSKQPKHSGANTPTSVVARTLDALRNPLYGDYHIIPSIHDAITYYGSKLLPDRMIIKMAASRGLKYSPEELR
jgi:short-subunit dehydrogenase